MRVKLLAEYPSWVNSPLYSGDQLSVLSEVTGYRKFVFLLLIPSTKILGGWLKKGAASSLQICYS
jgi:hypothetical protein